MFLRIALFFGYLNHKTKGSRSRFQRPEVLSLIITLYTFVLEDYINKGFCDKKATVPYTKYEGARFSDLFRRQRELPFGSKLQNHALNSRLNDEFRKFYPTITKPPIVRDLSLQRYWVQEDLLRITIRQRNGKEKTYNIAHAIIEIIDRYVEAKRAAFEGFLDACKQISRLGEKDPQQAIDFIAQQLGPNVDARIFEVVSYAILKAKYAQESIWIGNTEQTVSEEFLVLYKTGRTNANDGGIDFVMKPLGRFFQVTETTNVDKYFLDIDKIQRFPITFVVKSDEDVEEIRTSIQAQAIEKYRIESVVETYMNAIEEIINLQDLLVAFGKIVNSGQLQFVMDEIILQSKVEFYYDDGNGTS